jgi:CubicO group peptidase (beta-lactamase class C family)
LITKARYIALGLALFTVVAGVTGYVNRDKLERLANVNSLFNETKIVSNFSSIKDLFYWAPVARSGPVFNWPVDKKLLPANYVWKGTTKNTQDWLKATSTTSLVVIKNGNLVFEDYYLGTKPEDRRISWSVAKSFLSAMFGIAVTDGRIKSLDDPVDLYAPMLKGSVYEGVPIRNVLNMASGIAFNEDYLSFWSDINKMGRVLALGGSMDGYAASLKNQLRKPGLARQYTSIDTHVLSMVLREATGMPLQQFMEQNLWNKLGVEQDAYYVTDSQNAAFALGGLNVTSRDYARFGQMMLDFGAFNGQQIIPAAWAVKSVENTAPKTAGTDRFGYGYQWWLPENAKGEFFAVGVYGQYIYVNRPLRTVVVKTSADRAFMSDGEGGALIAEETIEMFRAFAKEL